MYVRRPGLGMVLRNWKLFPVGIPINALGLDNGLSGVDPMKLSSLIKAHTSQGLFAKLQDTAVSRGPFSGYVRSELA